MDKNFEYKVVKSLVRNSINTNHLILNMVKKVNIRMGLSMPPAFKVTSDDIIRSYAKNFNLDYEKLKNTKLRDFKEW